MLTEDVNTSKKSPLPPSTFCLLNKMKSKHEPSHCFLLSEARDAKDQIETFIVMWPKNIELDK